MRFRETFQIDPGVRDLAVFAAEACARKFNLPAPKVRFFLLDSAGIYEVPFYSAAFEQRGTLWIRGDLSECGAVEKISSAMYRASLMRLPGSHIDGGSIMPAIDSFGRHEGLPELQRWLDAEIVACSKSK